MSTYRTVSDEVSLTDWSHSDDRYGENRRGSSPVGIAIGIGVAVAALLGIIYLLPPGSY